MTGQVLEIRLFLSIKNRRKTMYKTSFFVEIDKVSELVHVFIDVKTLVDRRDINAFHQFINTGVHGHIVRGLIDIALQFILRHANKWKEHTSVFILSTVFLKSV